MIVNILCSMFALKYRRKNVSLNLIEIREEKNDENFYAQKIAALSFINP